MHVSQEIILMYTLTTDISEILYILVEFRKIKMNQHSTVKPPKKHREPRWHLKSKQNLDLHFSRQTAFSEILV